MRGIDDQQADIFSYVQPEERVPKDHPLRAIRSMANRAMKDLHRVFNRMYSVIGRPSIPPEYLLRASILQYLYSIRSERLLMEQLEYNLLFRWFVGLSMDSAVWDHSTFSKNRDRFIGSDIAMKFMNKVIEQAKQAGLLSDEHFTVDGTLLEAWASMKSLKPIDESQDKGPTAPETSRNEQADFHGEKRSNETHRSTTDGDARLYKKSKGEGAKLCYMGHALMENRNGMVVGATVSIASGTAEREAAVDLLDSLSNVGTKRRTLGADKGYDVAEFVTDLRRRKFTPHVAKKKTGKTIDGRTMRQPGYRISQRARKRVEEIFGWAKTIGELAKLKVRGLEVVRPHFVIGMAVFNLVRMSNLMAEG